MILCRIRSARARRLPANRDGKRGGPDGSARERRIPGRVSTLDAVLRVLDDPRRRYLLYAIQDRPDWDLDDLAARIAAWETDRSAEAVGETTGRACTRRCTASTSRCCPNTTS